MGKTVRTAAMAVAVVAASVVTAGAAAGLAGVALSSVAGLSMSTWAAVGAVASSVSALTAKKPGQAATGTPTKFLADPHAGIPYAMGRTLNRGNIIYRKAHTSPGKVPNDRQTFVTILSGGGPIEQIEGFYADKTLVTFNSAGAATGHYAGYMWQKTQRGLCPEPAALSVSSGDGSPPPGWTTQHKLSGYAASIWTLRWDAKGKIYPNGTPEPGWVGKWVKVYDPRQDSTYPGGVGPCRPLQEDTYVWSDNPFLHALTWALGRWQNGKRVLGFGAPITAIDVPSFVEGANVCDANGWKVGGVEYSTERKWDVFRRILQAGGGERLDRAARISCMVNAPRVSLDTIDAAALAGEVSVAATQSRRDRINAAIPRYRSENHGWEIVAADKIVVPEHVAEDGGERCREIDMPLVQVFNGEDVIQPAQLARYAIENSREFGPIRLPLKIRWVGYKPGDCITVNIPEAGLHNQPVIILNRAIDPESGGVTLTCRSETVAKHAFALGQTGTPPPTPGVSGPPLVPVPSASEWTVSATQISAGGVVKPSLVISGAATTADPHSILFEYREATGQWGADEGWIAAGTAAGGATRQVIPGVLPGAAYEVAVSYVQFGQQGGRLKLGPVTTGGDTALDRATDALSAAQAAEADAAAALSELNEIGADGWLHPSEKLLVIREFKELTDEKADINAKATAAGATAENNAYNSAYSALSSYLAGLSPAWNSTAAATSISRATWNSRWEAVYSARQILLNKIADIARQKAEAADSKADAALTAAQAAEALAGDAKATADGKINTWFQPSPPSMSAASHGDLWRDTDDKGKTYRFFGPGVTINGVGPITINGVQLDMPWVSFEDERIVDALIEAAGAQATADRKIVTFYSETAPTAEGVGDLWQQPSTKIMRRWSGSAWVETASLGAPPGTHVGDQPAETVATVAVNFNRRNDRDGSAIANPTIAANGTAVDHTINTDGSADVSFEWAWSGNNADIDGFIVYARISSSAAAYTMGTAPAEEQVFQLPADKRALILYGVPADKYITFGVRAFRVVDPDIAASGIIQTPIIQPTRTEERPYRPTSSVAFTGDITGTVAGTAASVIVSKTQNLTPGGMLNPAIGIDTGVLRTLGRDISIVRLRDGETFVFPADWGTNPPAVAGIGRGMISSTEFIEVTPINVTSAGFTARCKKVTAVSGVETQITAFATASSPRVAEKVKPNNDIAFGDRFTFTFDVNVASRYLSQGEYEPGSITLGFWTFDGAVWQMNTSATYGGWATQASTVFSAQTISVVRPNMGNGSRFGISIVSNRFGGGVTAFSSISYNAVSSVSETTATPLGFPGMDFLIVGGGKVEG